MSKHTTNHKPQIDLYAEPRFGRPRRLTRSAVKEIARTLDSYSVPGEVQIRDTSLKGFMLRIRPNGRMTYFVVPKRGKTYRIGDTDLIDTETARTKALEIAQQVSQGIDPRSRAREQRASNITFNSFLASDYAPWVMAHRKDGKATIERLRACFQGEFGGLKLAEIDAAKADRWRTARLQDGLAPATVNRDFVALKAALSKALEWGVIKSHPLAAFKPLRTDNKGVVRYLTQDEELRLRTALDAREARIRAAKASANAWRQERGYELRPEAGSSTFADHLKPMVLVSINTGLRRGELFSLAWTDLDAGGRILHVRGDNAKSGSSRPVDLNAEVRAVLSAWREQCGNPSDGLVFPNQNGGRFNNINTSWRGILKAADIKDFRWHDLRHTFASNLVMEGENLSAVRKLMGHSDIKMTLRYAHLAPEHTARAVARLDARRLAN